MRRAHRPRLPKSSDTSLSTKTWGTETGSGRRSRPHRQRLSVFAAIVLVLCGTNQAWASGGGHEDPVAPLVLGLAILLVAARLGGEVATRLGQAAVLGELVAGVALGNLDLFGVHWFESLGTDSGIDLFARVGVLILLFEVGLESTVAQMRRVGVTAMSVAVLGVAAPFALGWGVSALLLPAASLYTHAFIGAALTATSVGITARVLMDLGQSQSDEARIILGAAVIDDVLGLVILALVTGVIAAADQGTQLSAAAVGATLGKAIGFLAVALFIGSWLSRRLFSWASRLRAHGVLLALSLVFCFVLSWAAQAIGLAPIVGAFAAGLVLEDVHFQDFVDRGERELKDLVEPISGFLVPIFFVVMGIRTDLQVFGDPRVIALAGGLCVAAFVGKQLCSLGVPRGKADRLTVGLGMVPRGEVGLIFANIGLTLSIGGQPVVDRAVFGAVVVMVIVTTFLTPPALKWSIARARRRAQPG